MMSTITRRPDHQWCVNTQLIATRVSVIDPSELIEELASRGASPELISRAQHAIERSVGRAELFELIDHTRDHTGDHTGARSHLSERDIGWALFTLDLQLVGGERVKREASALMDGLRRAAVSWVIARGGDALTLWIEGLGEVSIDDSIDDSADDSADDSSEDEAHTSERLLDWLNRDLASLAPTPTSPTKLITLAPSNLEVIDALDAGALLIACEDSSDLPERLARLGYIERLGPDLNPDLGRCQALEPDLVLSSLSVPGMERVVTGLAARGLPQLVLAPRSLSEVCGDLARVASALNILERGEAVIARLHTERDALLAAQPQRRARVYLEWWPKPMFTPGASCFSNELIALAGGVNVFGERRGSSVEISPEELVSAEPDICFVSWCGAPYEKLNPDNLRRRAGLEALNERARAHVIPIDEAYTGRPGPNMLEASRQMARAIRALEGVN